MTSPFRAPGQRPPLDDEDDGDEGEESLGSLRSRHGRKGALAYFEGGYPIVDLHQHGLVRRGANDTSTEVFFDDVQHLFYEVDNPLGIRVRITTLSGRALEVPGNLDGVKAIHAALDRFVTMPFTKLAKEALARGEHLTFGGKIVMQLDTVVIEDNPILYSDLHYVAAEEHVFVFYAKSIGRVAWVKIGEVPHPKVFLEVMSMRTEVVLRGFAL